MNKYLQEEFEEIKEGIAAQNEIQRKEGQKSRYMTVSQMGKLLGLKKTDRYWLVNKKVFKSEQLCGQIRIDIESFETWYANQVKYKKVTGEEPGLKLKEWSYSPQDIAEMLGVTDSVVYDLIIRNNIPTVTVDYCKRVSKDNFETWYQSQTKYRKKQDRDKDAEIEAATITMPEMGKLLGVGRKKVYAILRNPKYSHFFEIVTIAERKRITKKSFESFLQGQKEYQLDKRARYEPVSIEENLKLSKIRCSTEKDKNPICGKGNLEYLTQQEAARLAEVSRPTIIKWGGEGLFPQIRVGHLVRIPREPFEQWLQKRKEQVKSKNGIN